MRRDGKIHFRIDRNFELILESYLRGRTKSEFIREAIEEKIDKEEKENGKQSQRQVHD